MIYEHCSFFTCLVLPVEFLYRLYNSNIFVLLLVSIVYLLTWPKKKVSQLTFLFCYFISVLLRPIAALQFHTFCCSSMMGYFERLGYHKKKSKKIAFGNKEHTKSRKSETRSDRVSTYETPQPARQHTPLAPANNQDGLNDPKGNKI